MVLLQYLVSHILPYPTQLAPVSPFSLPMYLPSYSHTVSWTSLAENEMVPQYDRLFWALSSFIIYLKLLDFNQVYHYAYSAPNFYLILEEHPHPMLIACPYSYLVLWNFPDPVFIHHPPFIQNARVQKLHFRLPPPSSLKVYKCKCWKWR